MADHYISSLAAAIADFRKAEKDRLVATKAANEAENKILELIGYHRDCDCPTLYLVPCGLGHTVIHVHEERGRTSISILRDTQLYPFPNFTRCLGNASDHNASAGSLTPCPQRMSCLRFTLPAGEHDETSNRLNPDYSYPCIHYIKDVTVPPAASSANLQSSSGAAEQG